jgi:hypothetical protein
VGSSSSPETSATDLAHVISWLQSTDAESGLAEYEIQYRTGVNPKWTVERVVTQDLSQSQITLTLSDRLADTTYFYRMRSKNGALTYSTYATHTSGVTSILTNKVISNVSNYPNPFDSRKEDTIITYFLNQDTAIKITVYDPFGHKVWVKEIDAGTSGGSAGTNEVTWDGANDIGQKVAKGGYICVIQAAVSGEDNRKVRLIGVVH